MPWGIERQNTGAICQAWNCRHRPALHRYRTATPRRSGSGAECTHMGPHKSNTLRMFSIREHACHNAATSCTLSQGALRKHLNIKEQPWHSKCNLNCCLHSGASLRQKPRGGSHARPKTLLVVVALALAVMISAPEDICAEFACQWQLRNRRISRVWDNWLEIFEDTEVVSGAFSSVHRRAGLAVFYYAVLGPVGSDATLSSVPFPTPGGGSHYTFSSLDGMQLVTNPSDL